MLYKAFNMVFVPVNVWICFAENIVTLIERMKKIIEMKQLEIIHWRNVAENM